MGFLEVPTKALGLMPQCWELPPVQRDGNVGSLPWQAALRGPGELPAPSHCQVYWPTEEREHGLPQLPAEQTIP
jgi:hypothetical protein